MTIPYPLQWPDEMPRSRAPIKSQFRTGLSGAMKNVRDSLRLFGSESGKPASAVIISSNASLGDMEPKDAGVAVWFIWEGEQRCIAVDRYGTVQENLQAIHHVSLHKIGPREMRNRRSVWTIPTQPYAGAHFAAMPPALAELCIRAGSRPGDMVLDPFGGAGTTALAADRLQRSATLIELNPRYVALARERLAADAGFFNPETAEGAGEKMHPEVDPSSGKASGGLR